MSVTLRKATTADRQFLLDLVPRLRAFGPPPLRPVEALDEAERNALNRALDHPQPDHAIFVGELPEVGPAGIAYVETETDYFTGERLGHLSILIVAEAGEGQGVGKALLAAVEEWAAAQGYRFITLNVFAGNSRARAVYEHAGYSPDIVRYAKELSGSTEPRSPRSS